MDETLEEYSEGWLYPLLRKGRGLIGIWKSGPCGLEARVVLAQVRRRVGSVCARNSIGLYRVYGYMEIVPIGVCTIPGEGL